MGVAAKFKPQTVTGRRVQSGFFSTLARFKALRGRQKWGLAFGLALMVLSAPIAAVGLVGQSPDEPSPSQPGNYMKADDQGDKNDDNQPTSQADGSGSSQSEDTDSDGDSNSASVNSSSVLNVQLESHSVNSSSEPSSNHSSTDLEINGQAIPIPVNGILRKKIKTSDGTANLNVSVKNSSSASQTGGAND